MKVKSKKKFIHHIRHPSHAKVSSRRVKKNKISSPPLPLKVLNQMQRPKRNIARLKVVGIGGGGGNAITRMVESGKIRGVEFVAINTDAQDLDYASAHQKIYIGKALTKGLGAGMNPEIGKQAAEENRSEIGEMLEGADVVFLTAGMGGGTGSGALGVVAEIAREKGILTLAIVTKPFTFEGPQRMNIATEAINRFKDKVDAYVVIPNDRIFAMIGKDTPMMKAFGYIDDVLKNAVQAVADLVNMPGIINVDFADIKAVLKDAGAALIGIGMASGQDRSMKAVNEALNSPLLELSIEGAKGVLFCISGGRDLKMTEIHDIAKTVSANLDPNVKIIFGAYHDRNLKDGLIKATIIATGFNGIFRERLSTPTLFVNPDFSTKESPKPVGIKEKTNSTIAEEPQSKNTSKMANPPSGGEEDSWEVPAFLRKKRK